MSFESLGLSEPILAGVSSAGYETPTEIQTRAIPLVRERRDVIALGQTGSGKTAAFGLPLLEQLLGGDPGLRALILVPTRELCVQVAQSLRVYAEHTGLAVCTAFGGIPIGVQEAAIRRGLDVLVACPGRLLDHLQSGNFTLGRVEILVLDEADRMLDMGFMPQIRRILAKMPSERQNLMFSATMPQEIQRLVEDHFGKPVVVQVGERSQVATTITHRFDEVRAPDKLTALEELLRRQDGRVLIFVKTKLRAEELGRKLQRAGLPADSIHGDKSAESRHVVLQSFARGKTRFMVATDVAARGIDVSDIQVVVNFDMPNAVEDYVHRVGRTGRAGSEGRALTLVTRPDKGLMRAILAHVRKTKEARVIVDGEVVQSPRGGGPQSAAEPAPPAAEPARPARETSRGGRGRRRAEARPTRDDASGGDRRRSVAAASEVSLSRRSERADSGGFGAGVDDARARR